ncbi:hypothetical protein CDAR_280241 [Caerostris darwini]|uniref:Uncharacterized protein n=1 Tax=Caerostris darwini TaxID=1538125 RepID=A0AAV4S7W3_9ARAC|nr:hypothetical protein CDAR_280241 [Caerostris darwini]
MLVFGFNMHISSTCKCKNLPEALVNSIQQLALLTVLHLVLLENKSLLKGKKLELLCRYIRNHTHPEKNRRAENSAAAEKKGATCKCKNLPEAFVNSIQQLAIPHLFFLKNKKLELLCRYIRNHTPPFTLPEKNPAAEKKGGEGCSRKTPGWRKERGAASQPESEYEKRFRKSNKGREKTGSILENRGRQD